MRVMADLSSVCRAAGQRLRWAALMLAPVLALATGCAPDPADAIAGRWVIDVDRWLADPAFTDAAPAVQTTVAALARSMAAATVYTFDDGHCTRTIAGRVERWACHFVREARGELVFAATAADGSAAYVRLRVHDGGMSLTLDGSTVPVRRGEPGGMGN